LDKIPSMMWKSAFIANARGNQSTFYNNLDIGTHSMHIHASIICGMEQRSHEIDDQHR